MNFVQKALSVLVGFGIFAYSAVINGQAYIRDGGSIYTCVGSRVFAEKISDKNATSLIGKVLSLMLDQENIRALAKYDKTEAQKMKTQQELKKLESPKNKALAGKLMKMKEAGQIKIGKCDTEGRFFFEGLAPGYYSVATIVRPSLEDPTTSSVLQETIEVKEGYKNQVILYIAF